MFYWFKTFLFCIYLFTSTSYATISGHASTQHLDLSKYEYSIINQDDVLGSMKSPYIALYDSNTLIKKQDIYKQLPQKYAHVLTKITNFLFLLTKEAVKRPQQDEVCAYNQSTGSIFENEKHFRFNFGKLNLDVSILEDHTFDAYLFEPLTLNQLAYIFFSDTYTTNTEPLKIEDINKQINGHLY